MRDVLIRLTDDQFIQLSHYVKGVNKRYKSNFSKFEYIKDLLISHGCIREDKPDDILHYNTCDMCGREFE